MNYFIFQVILMDNTERHYAVKSETATAARQIDGLAWNDSKNYGAPKYVNGQKVSRTKYMNALATHYQVAA